jgi:hypothetical protein
LEGCVVSLILGQDVAAVCSDSDSGVQLLKALCGSFCSL